MNKIRINELARELEVKAHEILDRLPGLGVTEKKTHSSSIDEDVAIKLRRILGHEVPEEVSGPGPQAAAESTPAPASDRQQPAAVETATPPKFPADPPASRGPPSLLMRK